jgi:disease resistance protein RPS4
MTSSSSWVKTDGETPQDQVFINFRGVELRKNFVSHLEKGLKRKGINAFIDTDEEMGQELSVLLERIEGSRIALAIFSPRYTESKWCLKELAKMKERTEQKELVVIPIFYKVQPVTVKELKGDFGDKFRELVKSTDKKTKKEWKEALQYVPFLTGIVLDEKR